MPQNQLQNSSTCFKPAESLSTPTKGLKPSCMKIIAVLLHACHSFTENAANIIYPMAYLS